ncbi:hypothetical protein [Aquimarina megaterium]|uniref:hypothetical protein n=1 Tax=Aquimarina megaterium TaxID=1443666 RepID=UPI000943020B|nr:hypothetical protein [Aquimarina megaterium]
MWKQVMAAVLGALGLSAFKEGPLEFTAEEKKTIDKATKKDGFADKFMKEYNAKLALDGANNAIDKFMEEQGIDPAPPEAKEDSKNNGDNPSTVLPNADASLEQKLNAVIEDSKKIKADNEKLAANVEKLKILPDADDPEIIKGNMNKGNIKHSATHLFGIDASYNEFEGRPWNQAAKQASLGQNITAETDWTNTTNIDKINQDLQNYYRVENQKITDTLLDGLVMKKYVELISGVSDEYTMLSIVTGEITQSMKSKYLPKNKAKFESEKGKVRDIQIDMTFKGYELKKLEKSYLKKIASLRITDSNPYKEPYVRYLVGEIMKRARKEDKIVMGRGVWHNNPDRSVPASFMNNADGYLKLIDMARDEGKYIPFKMGKITPVNAKDYIKDFVERIPYEFRKNPDLQLVSGGNVIRWYNEARKLTEGTIQTYSGDIMTVEGFSNIELVEYDQLEGSGFIYLTTKTNEKLLTDKPGESGVLQFEKAKRDIDAFGDYKIGPFIAMFGRKQYDAKGYNDQIFFSNDVEIVTDTYVPADTNDATPSLSRHHSLIIGAYNTAATNITNLDDAIVGKKVYLLGNPNGFPSTVKNNANIILADGDFVLEDGNLLVLNALPGGKFIEVERRTGTVEDTVTQVVLADGAASADALEGNNFVTSSNTAPTALTNISNAVEDEEYTITGGSDTNATTIASSGNFFLSAAITLNDGVFITVVYSNGKFIEVARG